MESKTIVGTLMALCVGFVNLMGPPQDTKKDTGVSDYVNTYDNPFHTQPTEYNPVADVEERIQLTSMNTGNDVDVVLEEVQAVLSEMREERKEFQTQVDSLNELIERVGAPGSFQVPESGSSGCNCTPIDKEELRQVVREEMEEVVAGMSKTSTGSTKTKSDSSVTGSVQTNTTESQPVVVSSSPVASAVSTPLPVVSAVSYGSPVYSGSGGGSTGGSTTFSTPNYYPVQSFRSGGSTGGSSAYSSSPVYSTQPSTRTVTRRRLFGGTVSRTYGSSPSTTFQSFSSGNRYFVNEYGCTVDRTTGKVVSCPANKR